MHVPALLPPADDAGAQEQPQVPRDVRLAGADLRRDLEHARLAPAQHVEDPQASRVGEDAQSLRHRLEHLVDQIHNQKRI